MDVEMTESSVSETDDIAVRDYGAVLEEAVELLKNMSENKPKTVTALKNALKPACNILLVCSPLWILKKIKENTPKEVKLTYKYKEKIGFDKISEQVGKTSAHICRRKGISSALLTEEMEEFGEEIRKNVKKAIQSLHSSSSENAMKNFANSFFLTKRYENYGELQHIFKNLEECGLIKFGENQSSRLGESVSYTELSYFVTLCLEQLSSTYNETVEQLLREGSKYSKEPNENNIFQTLLKSVNRSMKSVKHCIERHKGLNELNAGVEAYLKRKTGKRQRNSATNLIPAKRMLLSSGLVPDADDFYYDSHSSSEEESLDQTHKMAQPSKNNVDSLTVALQRLKTSDDFLVKLRTDFAKIKLDDIQEIPTNLKPESLTLWLALQRMGTSKPKTVATLCRALKPKLEFLYVSPVVEILRNLLKTKREKGKKKSPEHNHGCSQEKETLTYTVTKEEKIFLTEKSIMMLFRKYSSAKCEKSGTESKGKAKNKFHRRKISRYLTKTEKNSGQNRTIKELKAKENPCSDELEFRKMVLNYVTQRCKRRNANIVPASEEGRQQIMDNVIKWLLKLSESDITDDISDQQTTHLQTEKQFVMEFIHKCMVPSYLDVNKLIEILRTECIVLFTEPLQAELQSAITLTPNGGVKYNNLELAENFYKSKRFEMQDAIMSGT